MASKKILIISEYAADFYSLGAALDRAENDRYQYVTVNTRDQPIDSLMDPSNDAVILAYTQEIIEMPNYLAARVEGRSSLARLGISIHQTAPTVHANFEGQLRLEMSHSGPYACKIYPGYRVCQLVIERLGSPSQTAIKSPFQRQRQR